MIHKNSLDRKIRGWGIVAESAIIMEDVAVRGVLGMGHYSVIHSGSWISSTLMGNYVRVDKKVQTGVPKVFTGSFSNHHFAFSEGRQYWKNDSEYQRICTDRFFYQRVPLTRVGNDVRVGAQSVIFAGVTIGNGAVIYPYSVVVDDVEPYSIMMGNPARKIGMRFESDVVDRIENLDWTNKDLSHSFGTARINYLDIPWVVDKLESAPLAAKDDSAETYFNSNQKLISEAIRDVAVVGPSHVYNWQKLVDQDQVNDPGYLLYGEPGLSIRSLSIKQLLDWWILEKKRTAVLVVPDMRIGNTEELHVADNADVEGTGIFIYKNKMNGEMDLVLKQRTIDTLDLYARIYKDRIKFLFWSLYGREQTNIRDKKYLTSEGYIHPLWNYDEFKNRYTNNILDTSELGQNVHNLIDADGSIHPNILGYQYIAQKIQASC